MNIIKYLQQNENYTNLCLQALHIKFTVIDIDCSHGETDRIKIIFIKKESFSFEEAIAILIMKQKMLDEEWNDVENYTKEDIQFWITLLEKEYEHSTYNEDVLLEKFKNDYFVKRLVNGTDFKSILYDGLEISYVDFQKINPLNSTILKVESSIFKGLEIEYYIETESHFVLFNWYTTA
jgi:hypothetical protein